jgi:ribosomal protein S18 acetylase RimI-like enzyme
MNFYSEDIINDIVDNSPLEEVIDKVDEFKQLFGYILQLYSFHDIHYKYTQFLLADEKVKIAFYCMDFEFSIFNCPTMLLYRKYLDKTANEMKYYILLICTKHKFRNQGYASKLLDGLVERVKKENQTGSVERKAKIILSSVEEAVLFYESYGFRWTRESLAHHPLLMCYEKYEQEKEYFILEMEVGWI